MFKISCVSLALKARESNVLAKADGGKGADNAANSTDKVKGLDYFLRPVKNLLLTSNNSPLSRD
jgi:hypothetical protein